VHVNELADEAEEFPEAKEYRYQLSRTFDLDGMRISGWPVVRPIGMLPMRRRTSLVVEGFGFTQDELSR
jgi:hypothetical protein